MIVKNKYIDVKSYGFEFKHNDHGDLNLFLNPSPHNEVVYNKRQFGEVLAALTFTYFELRGVNSMTYDINSLKELLEHMTPYGGLEEEFWTNEIHIYGLDSEATNDQVTYRYEPKNRQERINVKHNKFSML